MVRHHQTPPKAAVARICDKRKPAVELPFQPRAACVSLLGPHGVAYLPDTQTVSHHPRKPTTPSSLVPVASTRPSRHRLRAARCS